MTSKIVLLFLFCGAMAVTNSVSESDVLNLSLPKTPINMINNTSACPCSNVNWCSTITTPPRKEVFAFSVGGPDWKKYDWSRVTTIAMFGQYNADLMCYAHSQGVRVVLKGYFSNTILFDKVARNKWIMDHVKLAIEQHMDGINIDVEFPLNKTSAPLLTEMVRETTKVFHNSIPNSQVTFDVAWSPMCVEKCCECIDKRCYQYKEIVEATDFVFVMSYDEQSQICGDCIAKANSPYEQTGKGVQGFLDLGIDPDKLVLGVPWYGYDYPCLSLKKDVCSIEKVPFRGVACSDAAGKQKEYQAIQGIMRNNATSGRIWNDSYKAPYFNFKNATGYQHQMWYDDPESLNYRMKFAKDKKLGGVGMWHIDCLDYSNTTMVNEMWATFDTFLK
ncbi:di-N-acetylchitobiase-like [Amphiura filiformis]|uniref:di-N-acetylchitobiase-like n=1 Tax=Amphiura filiformis TaxID=82378 RepID=UPI003B20C471